MNKNKIGLLYRVSSEIQETDGNSLDVQQKMGRMVSNKLGLEYKEFNEGVQSSFVLDIRERPVLIQLLDEISKPNGIRKVWVFNTDRLGRTSSISTWVQKVFLDYGVELYIGENYEKPYNLNESIDKLTLGVLSLISQYDNELRRMRSILGKRNSLKNGNTFIGGTVPFGYEVNHKKLRPHPIESKIVSEIYKMYDTGKSTSEIKQYLDRNSQIEPRRTKFGWNLGTIQMMLRKEIYIGEQEWIWKEKLPNGEVKIIERIMVKTPPLIDRGLWESVNKKIDNFIDSKSRNKDTNRNSLLKGLVKCSECKRVLGHRFKETNHYYGRCHEYNFNSNTKIDVLKCPMRKSLLMEDTDEKLMELVKGLVKDSRILREEFKTNVLGSKWDSDEKINKKIETVKKNIRDIELKISSSKDQLVDIDFEIRTGQTEVSIGLKLKERFSQRILELTEKMNEYNGEFKFLSSTDTWINWLEKMSNNVDEIDNYDLTKKREFLHQFISHVYVKYIESKKSHLLELNFKVPMVGDSIQYTGVNDKNGKKIYQIVEGNNQLKFEVPLNTKRPNPKKLIERTELVETIVSCIELQGMSLQQTCDFLNKNGLKPITGGSWYKSKLSSFYRTNREISPK
jgi:hypothetical protein